MKLIVTDEKHENKKNFQEEIRAVLDVSHYLKNAVFMLDSPLKDLEEIILSLFELISVSSGETFDLDEFTSKIFASSKCQTIMDGVKLRSTIQTPYANTEQCGGVNEKWIITHCSLDTIEHTYIGFVRFRNETNLGEKLKQCQLIVLILSPSKEKNTKSSLETSKSYATLLCEEGTFEQIMVQNEEGIKETLVDAAKNERNKNKVIIDEEKEEITEKEEENKFSSLIPFRGIYCDLRRRTKHYLSDFTDGVSDFRSVQKTISTTVFLLFTILPTSIAYGMLNDQNTKGKINVQKVILGQWIGGIVFGLIGGEELLILSTTAPLSIYIQVIYQISESNGYDFESLYSWVGIWSQIFLILYAILNMANLMKFTKRSTEEIFGLFIAVALIYKAFGAIIHTYIQSYSQCSAMNATITGHIEGCSPSSSLLFILLVFGTLWISMTLEKLRSSPYLTVFVRDIISDYSISIAVIIMAIITRTMFYNVDRESFNIYPSESDIQLSPIHQFPSSLHGLAIGLGFPLSLLFFMDQLLVTKTVDNKQNKLVKGPSQHWDLLVVGILNICLSLFGLPLMHAALPSAYLHLKALADVEERMNNGTNEQIIIHVRETRLPVLIAHILMIPIYFFLIPYFTFYIPTSLFHGLFLYMAFTSLSGSELWQRILLLFTQQRSYPARNYVRKVPQRTIHIFTLCELFQLIILLAIGFYPNQYVNMAFPVVIALFIPFRHFILPLFISSKHLEVLDSEH